MSVFNITFFSLILVNFLTNGIDENECSCLKNYKPSITNDNIGEFMLSFLRYIRWSKVMLLTDCETGNLIKQFSANFMPVAAHRVNTDLTNLVHFHSLIINAMNTKRDVFNILNEMLNSPDLSPQNWLIITDYDVTRLPIMFIPHDFNIVIAIPESTGIRTLSGDCSRGANFTFTPQYIKLLRVYSGNENILKTEFLGRWHVNSKLLRVKLVPTPLPLLTGKTFRVTSIPFSPHFGPDLLQPKGDGKPEGIYGEILQILKHKIDFTFTVQAPDDNSFGNVINRTHVTGMLQLIHENKSDIIVAIDMYRPRLEVIDYSHTVTKSSVIALYRNREATDWRFLFFLNPFSLGLWGSTIAICILVSILFCVVNEIISIHYHSEINMQGLLLSEENCFARLKTLSWFVQVSYYTLLRTGFNLDVTGAANRSLLLVFHLFSLIIFVQYSSVLTSMLTINNKPEPFKSLTDVILKSRYDIGTIRGATGVHFFKTADDAINKEVGRRMQKDPDRYITKTTQEGIDLAYSEHFVYLMDKVVILFLMEDKCSLQIAEEPVFNIFSAFAYRKGFPYKKIFDKYLRLVVENGIINKIEEKYISNGNCESKNFEMGLDKHSLIGLSVILLSGAVLSALAFCLEILIDNRCKLYKVWIKRRRI